MKACSRAKKIFKSFPLDVQKYFLKIDNRCKKANITLKLTSGKSVNSGGRCGGYFDAGTREIVVAIGRGLESVLCCAEHEFQHCFGQFLKPKSIWHKKGIITGHSRFSNYLSGSRIYKTKECAAATLLLELDCERKTLRALKKWSKYVDFKKATRCANAYVFSHYKMLETGKWLKKPLYIKHILAHCPDILIKKNSKLPLKLKIAFDRYL